MDEAEGGRYSAEMKSRRGDVEVKLEIDDERRAAIMKCIEGGDLRMVLKDVDLERLASGRLGGGYLWD